MNLEELIIGTLIEIYIRREGYNYRVVSKIESIRGNVIAVTPIAGKTRLFRFLPDDVVDLVYRRDEKLWKWHGVDAQLLVDEDGNKLHGFVVGGDAEAFNRRSTYRLTLERVLTVKYMVRENIGDNSSLTYNKTPELVIADAMQLLDGDCFRWVECECFLKDISEGGAAIQSEVVLQKGDELTFEIPSEVGIVSCKCVVVRARQDRSGYFQYSYGCSFIETSRNFTRFFYETQRKQLQRRRIMEMEENDIL